MTGLTPANENPWHVLATIKGAFERGTPNSDVVAIRENSATNSALSHTAKSLAPAIISLFNNLHFTNGTYTRHSLTEQHFNLP